MNLKYSKNIKEICVSVLFSVLLINNLFAQDFHYSQFYNTPIAQNPAFTGKFPADYRVGGAYRSQWRQINATFATTSVFADVNYRLDEAGIHKVGVGLMVVNDQLGDGIYSNQYYLASGAYHRVLDRLRRHKVSTGIQLGFVQKNINDQNLYFASQIDNYQVTTNPSGENSALSFGYINFNAGAVWDYDVNARLDIYLGASIYNINRPKETILSSSNRLNYRTNYNLGANYQLTRSVSLLPAIQFTQQMKAIDFAPGAAVGYSILNGKLKTGTVMLGYWYRTRDASIIYGGLKYKHYQLGLSYDITNSSLNDIKKVPEIGRTKNVGAFEITFIYLGFLKRALPNELTVPCRFF